jgi:P-type conjugative transfer ATPase TrbB
MLRTALGPAIAAFLEDPAVVEVMLNPDGRLWIDRLSSGLTDTGERLSAADGERIVRLVAHHVGAEVHAGAPRVSAELPETGERFEGLLPPVVAAPAFAIRKPAVAVFTLDDYVASGIMTEGQAQALRRAVAERRNIIVAGGTSTGKTTLTNALLAEVAKTSDRVVLIEDTRELQCQAPNLVALRTKDGVVSLSDLVRSSLRLRPDRIPIGEVRGAEALDLLKAWGTGHPGGIGTIHAGSGIGAPAPARAAHPGSGRHRSARPHRRDHRCCRRARRSRVGAPARRTRPRHRAGTGRRLCPLKRRRSVMIRRPFLIRQHVATAAAVGFVTLTGIPAWAAGSNMPWEQPLNQILQSVEGPVAKIMAVIVIVVTGLTLAFGDTSGGFRRLIQIVFGLSIAFAASSLTPYEVSSHRSSQATASLLQSACVSGRTTNTRSLQNWTTSQSRAEGSPITKAISKWPARRSVRLSRDGHSTMLTSTSGCRAE